MTLPVTRTRTRTRAGFAVAAAAATLAQGVVSAAPASAGYPGIARAAVSLGYTSTAFVLCAEGAVDDGAVIAGRWVWTYTLVHSDGSTRLVEPLAVEDGPVFARRCKTVAMSTPGGGIFSTLTFSGAGTSDYAAASTGVGWWTGVADPESVTAGM